MDSNPTTTTTSHHPINEIINNLNNQELLLFNLQSLTELLSISNEFHLLSTNYNNLISSLIQILSNYQNNAEIYLLACRSLSTTIDIFPLAILPFIHKNGLIPLKNLLLNTMYLDLADHILKPILKISFDFPRDILNANLLFPSLQYCDFFDLHLQRTAFQILSNVTSSLHSFTQNGQNQSAFNQISQIFDITVNLTNNHDQKLLELATKSLLHIAKWLQKDIEKLNSLFSDTAISTLVLNFSQFLQSNQSQKSITFNHFLSLFSFLGCQYLTPQSSTTLNKINNILKSNPFHKTVYHKHFKKDMNTNYQKVIINHQKSIHNQKTSMTIINHEKTTNDHEKTNTNQEKTIIDHEMTNTIQEKINTDHQKTNVNKEKTSIDHEMTNTIQEKINTDDQKTNVNQEKTSIDHEKTDTIQEKINTEDQKTNVNKEKTNINQEQINTSQEQINTNQEKTSKDDQKTSKDDQKTRNTDQHNPLIYNHHLPFILFHLLNQHHSFFDRTSTETLLDQLLNSHPHDPQHSKKELKTEGKEVNSKKEDYLAILDTVYHHDFLQPNDIINILEFLNTSLPPLPLNAYWKIDQEPIPTSNMYGHLESDSEDDEEMEEVESQTDSDEDEPLTFEQNVEDMSENDMDEDFIEQYAAKNKKETVEMDSRMDIVENDLTVSHPKPSIPLVTQDYHLHKDYPILILPLLTQLFLKTCQGNLKHKIIECINKIVYFTTDRDQLMGMKCEAFGNVLVQLIDVELDKCTVEDKMQALAGVTVIQILCDRMDVGVWFRRQGVTQGVEGLDKMCAGLVGEDVEPLFESVFRHRSRELWKLGQMQPRVAGWTTERVGVAALEAKLKTMVSALVVRLETSGESGCQGVALERYYRSVREIGCGVDAHQWDSIYNIFVELLMELGTKQMTMYEIFQTGLVEFLVDFLVAGDGAHVFDVGGSRWTMPLRTRVRLFQSLMVYQHEAFGHLVRLVQEHVSKIEDFEVMHVDGKEMVPHFGRQMRLALVCTDPNDFDKSVHLVHVSVPVVATFKVLEKYIKSRLVDIVPTSVSNERVVQVDVFKHEDGVASKIPVSYAQVTKAAIKDQIQFLVNGQAVSNESMIFKMIYQSMSEDGRKSIWNQTHRVEFKRSNLFIPNQIGQPKFRKQFNTCGCETCKEIYHDLYILKTGKVRLNQALLLLQALYCIQSRLPNQSKNNYQNEKITSKVIKQFSESIFTVSTIFPNWMIPILYQYRFLIDFEIRYQFIQISMMGLTRNIKNWNDYYKKQLIKSHRIDNSTTFQVEKKKVRIHRSSVFESMIKVIPMCIDRSLMLEVEFFDEVGTGLGPTLEFFTLISKNIRSTFGVRLNVQQQSHQLWRFDESTMEGFLDPQLGLYPRPLQPDHHGYQDIILLFQHIGSFVAKAFLDGRRLDFTFNTLFLLQTFQQDFFEFHHDTNQSLEFIKMIDLTLYQSLKYLVGLVESDAEEDQVAALTLEYSLPNYPFYNLNDQGNEDDMVTKSNLVSFIDSIINATILCGIQNQINAFRIGFEKILPTHYFDCFEVNELQSMFGSGKDEDWTREVLYDTIKADHGYSNQSRIYKEFIEMLIDFNQVEKRDFLLFCTGSPRLPINGFKSLTPPLTIVCKTTEDQPDEYLPSVMTCVNYLKVPLYSSAQVMKQRFVMAIQEGQASFHLS